MYIVASTLFLNSSSSSICHCSRRVLLGDSTRAKEGIASTTSTTRRIEENQEIPLVLQMREKTTRVIQQCHVQNTNLSICHSPRLSPTGLFSCWKYVRSGGSSSSNSSSSGRLLLLAGMCRMIDVSRRRRRLGAS
jgi:hypothetical protein